METAPAAHQPHWDAALRAAGRRVTRQRLAVLGVLERTPHLEAEAVLREARHALPDLTLQSVYVILTDLTNSGLLRRIEPPHSPARYETRVGDNHHHAICTSCGRVEDVDCAVGHAPCLTPSWTPGSRPMTIHVAEVLYQGVCSDCLGLAEAAAPELSS
ncbi:transcriptional repressor [Paenarthrobacter sp. DKR-5]|uniref:Fur family transcriptional regulator n=1 Tax=Paenarthrobacter sp. DKR-5 TaxID=2835535 RepID=UPI001BDC749C|nr:Fur family transcriptional regulator [Paenarthrobacter sp. DKR-5]MBT1001196.1 transcriptional repressor [Paenarthrobacter sp. DKR-5]